MFLIDVTRNSGIVLLVWVLERVVALAPSAGSVRVRVSVRVSRLVRFNLTMEF